MFAAENAASLTRQLLAYTRQQVLEPKVVNLNLILRHMEPLIRRLIGEDIDFQVRTDRTSGESKLIRAKSNRSS
jgi:hypothetical protein